MQCAMWGAGDAKSHSVIIQGGNTLKVEDTLSCAKLKDLDFLDTDFVFKTKSVRVNGIQYAVGLYVCIDAKGEKDVNLPIFGKISEIIVVHQTAVYLRSTICDTIYFDVNVNAYCIQCEAKGNIDFRASDQLTDYSSFCTWKERTSDNLYISLRHVIV